MPKHQPRNPSRPFPRLPLPLTLNLPGYRTPSLNRTLGEHWRVAHGEKRKAAHALSLALLPLLDSSSSSPCTGADSSTSTTPAAP